MAQLNRYIIVLGALQDTWHTASRVVFVALHRIPLPLLWIITDTTGTHFTSTLKRIIHTWSLGIHFHPFRLYSKLTSVPLLKIHRDREKQTSKFILFCRLCGSAFDHYLHSTIEHFGVPPPPLQASFKHKQGDGQTRSQTNCIHCHHCLILGNLSIEPPSHTRYVWVTEQDSE